MTIFTTVNLPHRGIVRHALSPRVAMSRLEDVAAADGWRCWICDEPVDPHMSVNDPRGPSIDSVLTRARAKTAGKQGSKGQGPAAGTERLAHRGCNTRKGAVAAVVPWAGHLFVADPAPIIPSIDRLQRKGGREVMARCPTQADADEAAAWLHDRLSRLAPDMQIDAAVEAGGGQYLVVIRA